MRSGRILSEAERTFTQWAGLYSGKLFVQLVVYTDESGTHEGSPVPIFAGYVDTVENWARLCTEWQAVLDKYRAKYFHFRELGRKSRVKPNNPYHGWSDEKAGDFLYELALVISKSAVPVGGNADAVAYKKHLIIGNPIKRSVEMFFKDFTVAVNSHWPGSNEPVTFFFAQQEKNKAWAAMIHEVFYDCQKTDQRLKEYSFKDAKTGPGCQALQAADLAAYRTRQIAEKYYAENENGRPTKQPKRVLDFILMRNLRAVGDPEHPYSLKGLNDIAFYLLINELRKDEKRQRREWAAQGNKDAVYHPEMHFPFKKYGIEIIKPNTV
jgi:hypothetical protein